MMSPLESAAESLAADALLLEAGTGDEAPTATWRSPASIPAIALIDLLPDAGREAMAGWRAEAERRAGALAAAEALSAALPAN